MTRCERWAYDGEARKDVRCTDEGVWLCRRGWWCDSHARDIWTAHPSLFDVPRDQSTRVVGAPPDFAGHGEPTDWRVPAWLPPLVRQHADRLDGRVLAPRAPSLFDEATP